MNPVNAAQDGGLPVLIFALSVAGILIFILASLIWWFIKERIRLRERETDSFDKRFMAGREKFQEIDAQFDNLNARLITDCIHKSQFEKYCMSHQEEHAKLDRRFEEMKRGQISIREDLVGINEKVDTGFDSVKDLLAKIVTIHPHEDDL